MSNLFLERTSKNIMIISEREEVDEHFKRNLLVIQRNLISRGRHDDLSQNWELI